LAAIGIAVLLPLIVLLGTVVALGWHLQVTESGSMAPVYPEGSLAVVQPLDPSDAKPGMTLVFEDPARPGRLVAHRAVQRLPGASPVWQTKGDANATVDPIPVDASKVRGRVRWAVPGLGRIAMLLRSEAAPWVLVGCPLGLLAITEVASRRRRHLERVALVS
jgi:signal peptidase